MLTPEIIGHTVTKTLKTHINIGGVQISCTIEAIAEVTEIKFPAQNMSDRMEDAIPSSSEIEVDSAKCTVTLVHDCKMLDFVTTDMGFFHGHMDIDASDL